MSALPLRRQGTNGEPIRGLPGHRNCASKISRPISQREGIAAGASERASERARASELGSAGSLQQIVAYEAAAIVGVQSGQCLMPQGNFTGSAIVLAACDGSAIQMWQFVPGPSGYFVMKNQVNNSNENNNYNSGNSNTNNTNNANGIDNDNDNKS